MKLPVLMYHDIQPDDFELAAAPPQNRPYIQRRRDFAAQLDYLTSRGIRGATLASLEQRQGRDPGVVLTFDDGDLSNFSEALPRLSEHGHRATFFITTDFVGRPGYLSWDQVRELGRCGMEIGSHSVTHTIPATLGEAALFVELDRSRQILQDALGEPVLSFSLPTGFHHPSVERLARQAGYRFVANSKFGWFNSSDPFDVRRIAIKRDTSFREFCGLVTADPLTVYRKMAREGMKNALKGSLGIQGYERLRTLLIRCLR
jgi:peptidoglycan/xylan/chitin deacetylase (PgdA/CDA1 family)